MEEKYIGDGLFASFDGWQIKLRAPRFSGDHEVYLEPHVFKDVVKYAAGLDVLFIKIIEGVLRDKQRENEE